MTVSVQSADLVSLQHLPLLERLHRVPRLGIALHLDQVHQPDVAAPQLLHPPEVAQLQRPVLLL